jgi:hypothetical protein
MEPFIAQASQAEHLDYTMTDTFYNVVFGSMFGAVTHIGGGALSDAFGGMARLPLDQKKAIVEAAIVDANYGMRPRYAQGIALMHSVKEYETQVDVLDLAGMQRSDFALANTGAALDSLQSKRGMIGFTDPALAVDRIDGTHGLMLAAISDENPTGGAFAREWMRGAFGAESIARFDIAWGRLSRALRREFEIVGGLPSDAVRVADIALLGNMSEADAVDLAKAVGTVLKLERKKGKASKMLLAKAEDIIKRAKDRSGLEGSINKLDGMVQESRTIKTFVDEGQQDVAVNPYTDNVEALRTRLRSIDQQVETARASVFAAKSADELSATNSLVSALNREREEVLGRITAVESWEPPVRKAVDTEFMREGDAVRAQAREAIEAPPEPFDPPAPITEEMLENIADDMTLVEKDILAIEDELRTMGIDPERAIGATLREIEQAEVIADARYQAALCSTGV